MSGVKGLERLEQYRSQLQRLNRDFKQAGTQVGGDKDNNFLRTKLSKFRTRFKELEDKAGALLAEAPGPSHPDSREWDHLKTAIKQEKSEFDGTDRDVRTKEKSHPIGGGPNAAAPEETSAGGAAPARGGHTAVRMQDFKQIDDAELNTEDALQTEKLKGILEVEGDVNELHSMYRELNTHVNEQQGGLDKTEQNIDKSVKHVEKGVVELKSANKLQKSSRKKMFILMGLIALIVLIVIIVIVVTTKK